MTQEEKEVLLKDLSARLPYRVKVHVGNLNDPYEMVGIHSEWAVISTEVGDDHYDVSKVKPYLRPMSSMTTEEKEYYYLTINMSMYASNACELIDWLNKHHFDYRGLISKGLALEAENDTYKL